MRKRASLRRVVPEMGLDQAWAIRPESSRLIEQQLQRFAEHPRELAERFAIATEQWEKRNADPFGDGPGYELVDRVALIRFEGIVCKSLSFFGWLFGGSASTEVLIETLKNAENDAAVQAVCLRMDTPGGLSRGVHLAANAVFDFRTKKAIWGLVSDCCASAGYYIGSQCTKLFAESDTAEVGSIGTLMSYWDYSQALAANGVKVDVIRSAPLKGTGTFGTSLTPDQRAYLQATVDTLTTKFKATVARGRGFSPEQIDLVSDGRCWAADEALTLGLIDGVSTLEALIGPLQAEPPVVLELAPSDPPECDDDECDDSEQSNGDTQMATKKACDCCKAGECKGCKTCTCGGTGKACACCADGTCKGCKTCTHGTMAITNTDRTSLALLASADTGAKYKKGDRVEATADHAKGMAGMVGEVTIVRTGPPYYAVTFDKPMDGMKNPHKWLAEDELKTTTAKKAERDGAPAAHTAAPKETDTMNEDEVRALINGAVAPLQGENAALKAELATLKAQSDTTAKDVTATRAEQGLNKLLADARGENGGPVKLAAKDEVTAGYLRTVYETKGAEAAQTLLGTLPVIGNGKRTAAQQAETMGATDRGARHPSDHIANSSSFNQDRLGVHASTIAYMRENKLDAPGDYQRALVEVTRRRTVLREVEIA